MAEEIINDGVIMGERETDFGFAGAESPIPYEVIKSDGDWTDHLPDGEKQKHPYSPDVMGCVSFSQCNCIEIQEHQQTGIFVNYSDRFISKVSGTTEQGNFVWKPADAIRNIGMVLETDWPTPPTPFTWEQYYSPIPDAVYAKAGEWKKKWRSNQQSIAVTKEAILKALKQAPLCVVFPNHATAGFYCEEQVLHYFDTYVPYAKEKNLSQFTYAYQLVLTKNNPINMPSKLLATWLMKCIQAMEGYKDDSGVTYWADRLTKEGWNGLKAYFQARIPDRRGEQVKDVVNLDNLGPPPTE